VPSEISARGKILHTTGLTSEMVLKTVQMEIPILISRSGFTAWGVNPARRAGLTLIGRAHGKRFMALAGEERIVFGRLRRTGPPTAPTTSCERRAARPVLPTMPTERTPVFGVLLAGGRGQRMGGGDKFLQPLGGRPLLARVIERAAPQVLGMVISVNGDVGRFAAFALPVAADVVEGFAGPLAGILTGLEWAQAHAPHCALVASFATDTPFVPEDLVARLLAAVAHDQAEIGCACSGGRSHPVFGLWPVALAPALRQALAEGIRKVDAWTAGYRVADAVFPNKPFDPFFNVNTPEDLEEAGRLLALATGSLR
jgi:molybdenum cofactor guanylyltransferase